MTRLKEFAVVASAAMIAMTTSIVAERAQQHAGPSDANVSNPRVRAFTNSTSSLRNLVIHAAFAGSETRTAQPATGLPPVDVATRVRDVVPAELFAYFDLYLYVSKSATGPWSQHMYVFHKTNDGSLAFEQSFPVSTGRERQEKYFTSTPAGLFELDPDRFDRVHYSHRWNNAPMPWAMFLNYTIRARATGVALHSAAGHIADLGHRASGGCVRMPPEKAQELFERIQSTEAGRVPVFAMDDTGVTTDKTGRVARAEDGSMLFSQGYRVLLIIEDNPGAPTIVATLS
jgi:hypothetical protein